MTTDKFRPSRPKKSQINTLVKVHGQHQLQRVRLLKGIDILLSDRRL